MLKSCTTLCLRHLSEIPDRCISRAVLFAVLHHGQNGSRPSSQDRDQRRFAALAPAGSTKFRYYLARRDKDFAGVVAACCCLWYSSESARFAERILGNALSNRGQEGTMCLVLPVWSNPTLLSYLPESGRFSSVEPFIILDQTT